MLTLLKESVPTVETRGLKMKKYNSLTFVYLEMIRNLFNLPNKHQDKTNENMELLFLAKSSLV